MFKGRVSQFLWELKKRRQLFFHQTTPPNEEKSIVMLAGFQRSGTNMIMTALDHHPLTQVYHESDPRLYKDHSLIDFDRLQQKVTTSFAPFVVLKTLLDADRLAELLALFPQAKVIWPFRHYHDVVNSHMQRWPHMREHIDEIALNKNFKADLWRGRNMADSTLATIRENYRPDLSNADCKALTYYSRNDLFFSHGLDQDDRFLLMSYEEITENPVHGFSIMCDFIGLPYQPSIHTHVHTQSRSKNQAPMLAPHIDTLCAAMHQKLETACNRQHHSFGALHDIS